MSRELRFRRYVEGPNQNGCWMWAGARDRHGYGTFNSGERTEAGNARPIGAHRFAYELAYGSIPAGLVIDHLCEVPLCVNPVHLEAVTNAENLRRKGDRLHDGKCSKGHPWTPENTYAKADGSYRKCRRCHADYQNARYHARRSMTYTKEAVA